MWQVWKVLCSEVLPLQTRRVKLPEVGESLSQEVRELHGDGDGRGGGGEKCEPPKLDEQPSRSLPGQAAHLPLPPPPQPDLGGHLAGAQDGRLCQQQELILCISKRRAFKTEPNTQKSSCQVNLNSTMLPTNAETIGAFVNRM